LTPKRGVDGIAALKQRHDYLSHHEEVAAHHS
jgi:hypothetical protein